MSEDSLPDPERSDLLEELSLSLLRVGGSGVGLFERIGEIDVGRAGMERMLELCCWVDEGLIDEENDCCFSAGTVVCCCFSTFSFFLVDFLPTLFPTVGIHVVVVPPTLDEM